MSQAAVDHPDDQSAPPPPAGAVLGPLPLWAVGAVAGALGGEAAAVRVEHPALVAVGAVSAALLLIGVGFLRRRIGRLAGGGRVPANDVWAARWRGVAGCGLVVLVGVAGAAVRVDAAAGGLLPALAARGGAAELRAVVVHEPRPIADGWHVVVRITEVAGTATRERAALTVEAEPPPLGTRWRLVATARPLPEGGYGRWIARQHASVALDVVSIEAVGRPDALARASEHVRARVRQSSARHLPDDRAGLLVGFVTGDTRLLPEDDVAAMRATGLTHLTAVSGSNVAIVVGGVLGLCVLAQLGARGRRRLVAATVVWFAFVTRFEPSVLRAGTMALLVLLASARGVPRDARHALAGAVVVLVLVDPLLAGSLGLLLSATATAGVLAAAPRVRLRLERLPARIADLASITIGAQIAVVPVLLATFGEVSLASVPANVVAVPAAAVSAVIAFTGSAVSLISAELGAALFALAGQPARVVLWSAHTFRDVGGAARLGAPASVLALLAGCVWLLSRPRTEASRRLAAATAVLVVVASIPVAWGRVVPVRELTVTAIDVGQADAFLLESPGARILVDAGEDETAARWLVANGRSRIDLVVVTHPHLDHIGGVPEVLRRGHVGMVWYRPMPAELPEIAEMFAVADDRGVPILAPVAGEVAVVGDVVLEVLSPAPGRPYRWSGSELNDSSIVVRASWQGRRVLFTGDIEHAAQRDLLEHPERLRAELFTVPHHGAATSEAAFLEAVGAQVGLIGVGRENRHGHPTPEIIALLDELGVVVHRTDRDGTVRVAVPPPRPARPEPVSAPAALAPVPSPAPGIAPGYAGGHVLRAAPRG